MKLTVRAGGDYPVYDPGVYPVELASMEDAGMGQYNKPRVRLNWTLLDDDGNATDDKIPSWVTQVLSPKSTLYGVLCALDGVTELPEDAEIDLDEYIGKRCQVSLTVEQRNDGKGETNKITAYVPFRKRGAPARRTSAPPGPARAAAPAAEDMASIPF